MIAEPSEYDNVGLRVWRPDFLALRMMAENHVSLWRNLELADRLGTTEISVKANPCRR
jgi:hypothetical protein